MKWTITLLIVFGLIAALSAFILMAVLQTDDTQSNAIDVVVATQALPAMSIVSSHHIELKNVPRKGLAEGSLTDPTVVVGRVLSTEIKKGQILHHSFNVVLVCKEHHERETRQQNWDYLLR